jgi:hypothetical protein
MRNQKVETPFHGTIQSHVSPSLFSNRNFGPLFWGLQNFTGLFWASLFETPANTAGPWVRQNLIARLARFPLVALHAAREAVNTTSEPKA